MEAVEENIQLATGARPEAAIQMTMQKFYNS